MKEELLSRQQVAELLGVSLVSVNNYKNKGILKPKYKVGGKPLYELSDVLKQIEITNYIKTA